MERDDSPSLADRYAGCLLGLACGDALGGPVEFVSRQEIAETFPAGLRDFVGGGWQSLRPGEVTDDTAMALDLARSLVETGILDLDDIARRWVAWNQSGPKDIGNTTRVALDLIAAGTPWDEAGERTIEVRGVNASAGNGTVMRCAPVALRYRTYAEMIVQASIDTARITHADPRCTWGAATVNQAIAHLLDGGSKETLIETALHGIQNNAVIEAVVMAPDLAPEDVNAGGYVLSTISAAFWCLFACDTLEETIVAAVALGDDTDTTAAVAGALAGALYGRPAIPGRWLDVLEPRAELEALAERLLTLSFDA